MKNVKYTRKATMDDKNTWLKLNKEFMEFEIQDNEFWNSVNVENLDEFNKEYGRVFEEGLKEKEMLTIYIIEYEGVPIGFANCVTFFSVWAKGHAMYIDDLYIKSEYQGIGIGRGVMTEILNHAKECGYKRVQFQSEDSNPGARAFYEALGFSPTEMNFYVRYF